jgi:hypothetical protein
MPDILDFPTTIIHALPTLDPTRADPFFLA